MVEEQKWRVVRHPQDSRKQGCVCPVPRRKAAMEWLVPPFIQGNVTISSQFGSTRIFGGRESRPSDMALKFAWMKRLLTINELH